MGFHRILLFVVSNSLSRLGRNIRMFLSRLSLSAGGECSISIYESYEGVCWQYDSNKL